VDRSSPATKAQEREERAALPGEARSAHCVRSVPRPLLVVSACLGTLLVLTEASLSAAGSSSVSPGRPLAGLAFAYLPFLGPSHSLAVLLGSVLVNLWLLLRLLAPLAAAAVASVDTLVLALDGLGPVVLAFSLIGLLRRVLAGGRRPTEDGSRAGEDGQPSPLDDASVGLYRITRRGQAVQVNEALVRVLGYPDRESLMATDATAVFASADDLRRLRTRVEREGHVSGSMVQLRRFDGTTLWARVGVRAVRDRRGRTQHYEGVVEAIGERDWMTEVLKEREESRRVAEDALIAVYIIQDGLYCYANSALARIFGYEPGELVGRVPVIDLVHPDDRPLAAEHIRRRIEGEVDSVRYTFRGLRKDGATVHCEVLGRRFEYQGRPAIAGTLVDASEQWLRVQALRESEVKHRLLLSSIRWPVLALTRDMVVLYCNEACAEFAGIPVSELEGRNLLDTLPQLEHTRVVRAYAQALESGEIQEVEDEVGDRRFRFWVYPTPFGVLSFAEDTTERARLERQSEERRLYLESVLASVPDAIVTLDSQHRILEWNRGAERLFGYSAEEARGRNIDDLITGTDPRVHEEAERFTERVLSGERIVPVEIVRYHKDGTPVDVILSASPIVVGGSLVGLVAAYLDITERKRAEQALKRSKREVEVLFLASRELGSSLDLDEVLVAVLERVRDLLKVVAASVWLTEPETGEVVCLQATGPQKEVVRGWRLAPGQGLAGIVARTGESLIVSDTGGDGRYFREVDKATGLELRSILTIPLRTKREVIGVIQVVDTEPTRFGADDLALMESLAATAATAIENARLYERAQRDAETKSTLLLEVSHRVKNTLSMVVGLLYAEQRHANKEESAVYQSVLKDVVGRIQGLSTVHSLLLTSEWAPLPLSELARRIIESALRALPKGEHVSVDVAPSEVKVTPEQAHNLALVINELATNTVKHALGGRDAAHIEVDVECAEGWITLQFHDDGPGYPDEVLRKQRRHAGFDLAEKIVRKSLSGDLSLHNHCGAVTVVRFPVAVRGSEGG
jgi:PAS domain S-box-containing protein